MHNVRLFGGMERKLSIPVTDQAFESAAWATRFAKHPCLRDVENVHNAQNPNAVVAFWTLMMVCHFPEKFSPDDSWSTRLQNFGR